MRRVNLVKAILCLILVFVCAAGPSHASSRHKAVSAIQLCDVLRAPAKYTGKTVKVVARLTSMKEGTIVWAPGCPKLGVRMVLDLGPSQGAGLAELSRELRKYNLSSRPVIATLTGVYVIDYYDDVLKLHYPVFKITAAACIRRSARAEHPG